MNFIVVSINPWMIPFEQVEINAVSTISQESLVSDNLSVFRKDSPNMMFTPAGCLYNILVRQRWSCPGFELHSFWSTIHFLAEAKSWKFWGTIYSSFVFVKLAFICTFGLRIVFKQSCFYSGASTSQLTSVSPCTFCGHNCSCGDFGSLQLRHPDTTWCVYSGLWRKALWC